MQLSENTLILTQGILYEVYSFVSLLNFSHRIPILLSVKQCDTCSKVNQSLGNSIGHLSVHTMKLTGLCSDRSSLGPYNHHIRLNDVPPKKIHLVLGIPNFLDFFD